MKMVDKHLLCALAASMLAIGGARASPVTAMVTGDAVSALHLGITAHLAGPSEAGHDGIVHRVDADRLLAASSHDEQTKLVASFDSARSRSDSFAELSSSWSEAESTRDTTRAVAENAVRSVPASATSEPSSLSLTLIGLAVLAFLGLRILGKNQ